MATTKDDDKTLPLELQGGHNISKVKQDAGSTYKKIKALKIKRAEINDHISAHRESLKAMGIPRSAQAEVERRDNMDAEQRREHDFGVQVFGEAVGTPVDIFSSLDDKSDANPKSEPKKSSNVVPMKSEKGKAAKAKGNGKSRSLVGLGDAISEADAKAKAIADKAEQTSAARTGDKLN